MSGPFGTTKRSTTLGLVVLLPLIGAVVSDTPMPSHAQRQSWLAAVALLPEDGSLEPGNTSEVPDSITARLRAGLRHLHYGRFPRAMVDSADALTERIEAAAARPFADEWAGSYYYGNGLGVSVSLAVEPSLGFSRSNFGCLGLYELESGTAEWEGDRILLRPPARSSGHAKQTELLSELSQVRWGRRHYLIESSDLRVFCNAVNAGSEPRPRWHGHFFLKKGDEKLVVAGLPQVPAAFRKYLIAKPIGARITRILAQPGARGEASQDASAEGARGRIYVLIDAGRVDGLQPGMNLFRVADDYSSDRVTLEIVEDRSAVGVCESWRETPPSVGCALSSRDPFSAAFE